MISCKINFIGSVLPFFVQERLLFTAKDHFFQKRTATQFAPDDRAPKCTGVKQSHTRIGAESLFFEERPYKSANNAARVDGCDGGNDDADDQRGDDFVDDVCCLFGNRKVIVRAKTDGKIGLMKIRN